MKAERKNDMITLRLGPELRSKLEGDVARYDAPNLSEAARARIEASFHNGVVIHPPKTVAAELRERKLEAEVTSRELSNAKETGLVIAKDDVVDVWTKMCEPIRQAIQQVGNAVDGLTDEQKLQLEKWKEDTLTNLSGGGFE